MPLSQPRHDTAHAAGGGQGLTEADLPCGEAETNVKAKLAQFGYNVNQKRLLKSFKEVEDAWERYKSAYIDYLNIGFSVVNEAYTAACKELMQEYYVHHNWISRLLIEFIQENPCVTDECIC